MKESSYIKQLLKDYKWLFTPKNISMIRNKLKIYIPKDFSQEEIDKYIKTNDRLSIISKYDLIFNKNASDADLKKLEILFIIDYYLNIKQELMKDSEYKKLSAQLNLDTKVDQLTPWEIGGGGGSNQLGKEARSKLNKIKGYSISLRDPSIKKTLVKERNVLVDKIIFSKDNIDTSNLSENQLFAFLKKCLVSSNVKNPDDILRITIKALDSQYSQEDLDIQRIGTQEDEDLYRSELEAFEKAQKAEDISDMERYKDFKDVKGAEESESDDEFYPKKKPKYKSTIDPETGKRVPYIDPETGKRVLVKYVDVFDQDGNPMGEYKSEEIAHDLDLTYLYGNKSTQKQRVKKRYEELTNLIDLSKEDPNVLEPTPEEMLNLMNLHNSEKDSGKPKSFAMIATKSGGRWKKPSSVRQDIDKFYARAKYFSSNNAQKGIIYKALLDKYIEILDNKDLVNDSFVTMQNFARKNITKDIGGENVENTDMTFIQTIQNTLSDEDMRNYFSGKHEKLIGSSDYGIDKLALLDTLIDDMESSFKIFSSDIMKEFYSSFVWSKTEHDITRSIIEYFKQNFPGSNIGASLPENKKADKVRPEEGKILFNTIIYWVMKRSYISKSDGVVDLDQDMAIRISNFKNNFFRQSSKKPGPKQKYLLDVEKYNQENKIGNKIIPIDFTEQVVDNLLKDMGSDKGIIGSQWKNNSELTLEVLLKFLRWMNKKSDSYFFGFVSKSLISSWYRKKGYILSDIVTPEGTYKPVLNKLDNLNNIHLLSPKEEKMINSAASYRTKEYSTVNKEDLEKYITEYGPSKYTSSKFPKNIRDKWINGVDEVNYWNGKKLIIRAEIVSVSDDSEKVTIIPYPLSEDLEEIEVDVINCTPVL